MKITYIGYNFSHGYYFRMKRPEGLDKHVFIHIRSNAEFEIDGVTYNVPPNSIIFYKKGTPQNYGTGEIPYVNDWFHFELTDDEEKEFKIPFNKIMTFDSTTDIANLVEKMHFENFSTSPYSEEKINLYFRLLCCEILEKIDNQSKESRYHNTLYNIRARIYAEPETRWSNKWLSHTMELSESHFQRLYKKLFHVSPIEDSIRSRIKRGEYLLRNTDFHISAISSQLQYKNDVQFMRQFKKITGLTPTQYRKKHSKQ